MARNHEISRGPEHQQNRGEHCERGRPELAGHDFMQGMQEVIQNEKATFSQMEQNLIRAGILPNPFFNHQDQDCGNDQQQQQQQQQPQQQKSGGGIFGFLKDVVKEVAPIAAIL
jgi:hypothetical protein